MMGGTYRAKMTIWFSSWRTHMDAFLPGPIGAKPSPFGPSHMVLQILDHLAVGADHDRVAARLERLHDTDRIGRAPRSQPVAGLY